MGVPHHPINKPPPEYLSWRDAVKDQMLARSYISHSCHCPDAEFQQIVEGMRRLKPACDELATASAANTMASTSPKKPFSTDVSSPRPDEASPLFASGPSGSPEPSLPFISCVWCARTLHFPSKASDALLATPPPPSAFQLYPPPYLLIYRPPAYSYHLRASGGPPRFPLTSSDLDLSAPVR